MHYARYVATATFAFVSAQALQPGVHGAPQVAMGDNEWLRGISTSGEMQCSVDDGCVVGSGTGTCTVMVDASVPIELGSTDPGDDYDIASKGFAMARLAQFRAPKSDITITGHSGSSHWNLCWKHDRTPNVQDTKRAGSLGLKSGTPNVQDYCYYVNGICFLWASPCSGGFGDTIDLNAHTAFCPNLRHATEAEFSAALPTLNADRHLFFQKCAAPVLDPYFINCDYANTFVRVEDGQWNELVLVCGGSATVAGSISATGDPHLQNVHGERFDLMKPGNHVLIQIPKGGLAEDALLRVQADARRLGGQCADLYFQELNVTGVWAEAKYTGGLRFQARGQDYEKPSWIKFGKVLVKVSHGHTNDGTRYLNFYVKHLGHAGFAVGGLLGEDDHKGAAEPSPGCVHRTALLQVPALSSEYQL